ncbi:MAG: hypothetical protein JWL68_5327 [Actinomycetia bacterium]|nr:hypothetical protein [Actinomycetes bacterium]
MRTIFDGLVEEFRAWHLFDQQAGNPRRREHADLPGRGRPDDRAGRNGAGGFRAPGYGPSGFPSAGYGTPEYRTPQYGTPEFGMPEPGTPEYGMPAYGGAGDDWGPRHGRDLGGAPRPGGPR